MIENGERWKAGSGMKTGERGWNTGKKREDRVRDRRWVEE